jgi:hypothetical protein
MATKLISNGAFSGAVGALIAGRSVGKSATPGDYASILAIAEAFRDEFITKNAALLAPMADADNSEIGFICQAAAFGALAGGSVTSDTATDYATLAGVAVAIAKENVAGLV